MLSSTLFLIAGASAAAAQYAPVTGSCPSESLVRSGDGLSTNETAYRTARKTNADTALTSWLATTGATFATDNLPTASPIPQYIGLTHSGGGYRSLLLSAGVVQGLDARDSDVSVAGLYQAVTYQAGLSGGSWFLSSLAGNNWPTVSSLRDSLWEMAFQDSLLDPEFLLVAVAYADVARDLVDKADAGFDVTLTDPWGRLLSYQLLDGSDGGVAKTLSGVQTYSNFTGYNVPFPIITSLGVKRSYGDCEPGPNATTYEFSPFEFGSWDLDVSAFTPTAYLGTYLVDGVAVEDTCVTNYDNLGYILGTSSTLFNEVCVSTSTIPAENNTGSGFTALAEDLAVLLEDATNATDNELFAVYVNPFYNYTSTTPGSFHNIANNVSAQEELYLVDGGEALQNNPVFPMLVEARALDVVLVNDNSADTSNNYPNGSELYTTYIQSFNAGYSRMPVIPPVETFISEGLNTRATFFGCNDTDVVTIIYLPNYNFTTDSGISTSQFVYEKSESAALIANGVAVANQDGAEGWSTCLACGIMMKTGDTLPDACTACFEDYCYYS